MTSEINDLPFLTVFTPDTNSPTATSTSLTTIIITKGRLTGVGDFFDGTENALTLERKKSGTEACSAGLNRSVGCWSQVGLELAGLAWDWQATLEKRLIGVTSDGCWLARSRGQLTLLEQLKQ
jgi:hypothetical protein